MTPSLALLLILPSSAPSWRVLESKEGVRVETRDVPGSGFEEVRATTRASVAPTRLCEAVWGKDASTLEAGFRKRQTLRETETDRLTYEQIATPIVADRDYTLHVRREPTPEGGCRITFQTRNDEGPPPQPGFVRIPIIRGTWLIRPVTETLAEVAYTVYSEPGGSIPAFLARGPARERVVEWLKVILSRAERR